MIRVDPHVVPTRQQSLGTVIEVGEQDGEVPTVSSRRFETDSDTSEISDGHDRQPSESNER